MTKSGMRQGAPYRIATKTFAATSRWQTYILIAVLGLLVTVLGSGHGGSRIVRAGGGAAQNTIAVVTAAKHQW